MGAQSGLGVPALTIRSVRTTPVLVPMSYALGTSAARVKIAHAPEPAKREVDDNTAFQESQKRGPGLNNRRGVRRESPADKGRCRICVRDERFLVVTSI
jgi:hypothetical protein